jgi:hypothetical protein
VDSSRRESDSVTIDGWYGRRNHDHVNAKNVRLNGRDFDAASSFYTGTQAGN